MVEKLLLEEEAVTGDRWLEDIDTGDRYWVRIPAIATPAYQVRLTLIPGEHGNFI